MLNPPPHKSASTHLNIHTCIVYATYIYIYFYTYLYIFPLPHSSVKVLSADYIQQKIYSLHICTNICIVYGVHCTKAKMRSAQFFSVCTFIGSLMVALLPIDTGKSFQQQKGYEKCKRNR